MRGVVEPRGVEARRGVCVSTERRSRTDPEEENHEGKYQHYNTRHYSRPYDSRRVDIVTVNCRLGGVWSWVPLSIGFGSDDTSSGADLTGNHMW